MRGYIIKVGKETYATNAENVMEAEDKFIDTYPDYENQKLQVSECGDINLLNNNIVVF